MKPPVVLVVEDNEMNMELVTDVLNLAGIEILKATNATEALELTATSTPDLILMDIQLPGEMDGIEATRRLKANPATASIPVVAVTSLAMKGDREKTEQAGCVDYFVKPIDIKTFAEDIKKHLNQ
ncbi:response regulator [Candidatus Latescibacterota bacterium]